MDDAKIQKLKELIAIADRDTVTMQDLQSTFEAVKQALDAVRTSTSTDISYIDDKLATFERTFRDKLGKSNADLGNKATKDELSSAKGDFYKYLKGLSAELKDYITETDDKLKELPSFDKIDNAFIINKLNETKEPWLDASKVKGLDNFADKSTVEKAVVELGGKIQLIQKRDAKGYGGLGGGSEGTGSLFLSRLRDVDTTGLTKTADGKYNLGSGGGSLNLFDLDTNTPSGSPLNGVYRIREAFSNFLPNAGFDFWNNGLTSAPDTWTLAGNVTVARSSTSTIGLYSAQLTFGTANTGELYNVIGVAPNLVDYTFSCYAQRTSGTGSARLVAQDANAPYTEYVSVPLNSGSGWQLNVLTVKPTGSNQMRFSIKSNNAIASTWLVDEAMFQEGKGLASTFEYASIDDSSNQQVFGNKYFGYISATSFYFPSGSPGLGKVFTSDATGNASWQIPNFNTLTTTGTSGAATLSGGVLNIPQYAGGSSYTTANAQSDTGWTDNGTYTFNTTFSHNVGIGIATPVVGLQTANGTNALPVTSSTLNGSLALGSSATAVTLMQGVVGGSSAAGWIQVKNNSSATIYPLLLNPNGGNIGIGSSTTPAALLTIGESTTSTALEVVRFAYTPNANFYNSILVTHGGVAGGNSIAFTHTNGANPTGTRITSLTLTDTQATFGVIPIFTTKVAIGTTSTPINILDLVSSNTTDTYLNMSYISPVYRNTISNSFSSGVASSNKMTFTMYTGISGFTSQVALTLQADQKVGIGTVTSPTANLHVGAGSATNAQFKLDNGTILTTPIANNMENGGTHLYWTTSAGVRYQLDQQNSTNGPIPTLVSTTGINAKTVANTLAYTNPSATKSIVLNEVVVRCSAATSITSGPTIGFGTVSGTNDIFAATALTALTTTSSIYGYSLTGMSVIVPPSGTIYLNLTNASTGTSQTIVADLVGYNV